MPINEKLAQFCKIVPIDPLSVFSANFESDSDFVNDRCAI